MRDTPVEIRPLRSSAELAACVALQHEIWGPGFNEAVPASLLAVVPRVGGAAGGAFAPDGSLLGFTFGITGPQDGGLLHWLDMIGVRASARGQGIATRLMRWQADAARRAGATRMQWTFDPLQAANAWTYLVSLGARVVAYVPDMYPGSASPLHAGGTDRLLAEWQLGGEAGPAGAGDFTEERRIAIPAVLDRVTDPASTRQLRAAVRRAFTDALAAGFRVNGMERGDGELRYLLRR